MISVRRRVADAPLALLGALALAFGALLATSIPAGGALVAREAFEACETLATSLLTRLVSVGHVLPALVSSLALVAGALALAHQLVATRRMLRDVLARRAPTPRRVARAAAASGLADAVDYVVDPCAFAFCHGYRRPRVCLTSTLVELLDEAELRAVLRHEAHHARFRDPLKILACRSVASGLFFLPLAGALRDGYLAGKELCADVDATAGDGLPLARALLKLLGAARPDWPAGVLAIGALTPTEARLAHLLDDEGPRPVLGAATDWLATAALAAGLFGFSHGAAMAASSPPPAASCGPAAVAAGPAAPPPLAVAEASGRR